MLKLEYFYFQEVEWCYGKYVVQDLFLTIKNFCLTAMFFLNIYQKPASGLSFFELKWYNRY